MQSNWLPKVFNRRGRQASGALGLAALLSGLAACGEGAITGETGSEPGPSNPGPGVGAPPVTTTPPPGVAPGELVGRTPLRRLTAAQYDQTVRDLLGVEGSFAEGFGPDEEVGGFASNVTTSVGLSHVERFAQSAEQLAQLALENSGLTRLAPCAAQLDAAAEESCARQFVIDFGKRAFRRPLSDAEQERYFAVYTAGRTGADFAGGIELVITAMLQSPYFLYLPELGDPASVGQDPVPLSPYEIATRLAYFLRGSLPDAELLAAADNRQLSSAELVAAQTSRLLATPRATTALIDFHRQWLMLNDVATTTKDNSVYPSFTPELRQAMDNEVSAFVSGVMRDGDATLTTLLTAGFSFIEGPLYDVYGLPEPGAGAAGVTRVDLPAGQRAGILTLPATLTTFAHTDQSSPVARGFLISERLLCVTPPPAPPEVDTDVPPADENVTTRQRLEQHRTNPTCATCHGLFDPYGLAFENYDGIGRYRTQEGAQPVDATATLPEIGTVQNAVDLIGRLAQSETVHRCVAQSWFRYAFGRHETEQDAATVNRALQAFAGSGYRIPELLTSIASSAAFRHRTPVVR